mgnify:FL=1
MKRGEIWWVGFDTALGTEVRKTRPAVIVSNDASNAAMRRIGKISAPEMLGIERALRIQLGLR